MKYDREFWALNCHLSGEELSRKFGGDGGNWRRRIRKGKENFPGLNWYTSAAIHDPKPADSLPDYEPPVGSYKTSVEVLADGSLKSDRLLEMSLAQCKDPAYLMEAHGFDTEAWELVSAKNNIWNVYSKNEIDGGHDVSTLYASKITVKPIVAKFDIALVLDAMRSVEPVAVTPSALRGNGLLEIPLMDAHFGISTLVDYERTIESVAAIISRGWEQVLFTVGSDLFHHDNLRSTTARGTIVEPIDFPAAWSDAGRFYATLIELALSLGIGVTVLFLKGNHDESMAWAFCHYLTAKYPQLTADLAITERKVHRYGDVCIGLTHGDKSVKDFDRIFMAEFPEFARAAVKEIHTGHTHHEKVIDRHGVVTRTLATRNKTDGWHATEGYVGSCKRFQLFEYSETELLAIHYV